MRKFETTATVEEKSRIIALYREGKACAPISKLTGWSETAIGNFLKRSGFQLNTPNRYGIVQGRDSEIIADLQLGMTKKEALSKYGIAHRTLCDVLTRNGIPHARGKGKLKALELQIVKLYESGKSAIQIADQLNATPSGIRYALKRNGVQIRSQTVTSRKYECNESFFDVIDCEEKAYFLGWLYADGCNHSDSGAISLVLNKKDTKILERLGRLIFPDRDLSFYGDKVALSVHSTHMTGRLIELGCTPVKTRTLLYPIWMPSYLEHHFIRGYFDGDGSVYYDKHSCTLGVKIMSSLSFANSLNAVLIQKCSVTSKVSEDYVQVGTLSFAGTTKAMAFYNFIYKDATVYLERKRERFEVVFNAPAGTKKKAYFREIYDLDIDVKARGENNGVSKLTEAEVKLIKQELLIGKPIDLIAKKYLVHKGSIENIKYGRTWKHIQ